MTAIIIEDVICTDVRFPTSFEQHGSDAMHTDPNYSAVYVVLKTSSEHKGFGFTFTIGRGNEVVAAGVEALKFLVVKKKLSDIIDNFSQFWFDMVNESQLRWIGPEKGVIHLACAAIINAIWDLWAKVEKKPLWKLLVDMEPEKLVSLINFSYIEDFITPEEAVEILKRNQATRAQRETEMLQNGFPAYTTSAGWLGYSDDRIENLCREAMSKGFRRFKIKVGASIEDDRRRMRILRSVMGYDNPLMTDANQRWSISQSIEWMKALAEYRPYWIEEPTHADDIQGHASIAEALAPSNIRVATGEVCHNRVMFKQFLRSGGMQICQIDACRLAGVNEVLAVILMAAKAGVPVCPHAGGVGLCEYVQHFVFFDYISVSASLEGRMCEYADHLHEHFKHPVVLRDGAYLPPQAPGYSAEMHEKSVADFTYPNGAEWQRISN